MRAAINDSFSEFLNKTETLNKWRRGLTYSNNTDNVYIQKIQAIINYAINDCLAVTKLAYLIKGAKIVSLSILN